MTEITDIFFLYNWLQSLKLLVNGAAGDYEYDNDVPVNNQPNMVIKGNGYFPL